MEAAAKGARGHVDCREIVKDHALGSAVPIVKVTHPLADETSADLQDRDEVAGVFLCPFLRTLIRRLACQRCFESSADCRRRGTWSACAVQGAPRHGPWRFPLGSCQSVPDADAADQDDHPVF